MKDKLFGIHNVVPPVDKIEHDESGGKEYSRIGVNYDHVFSGGYWDVGKHPADLFKHLDKAPLHLLPLTGRTLFE